MDILQNQSVNRLLKKRPFQFIIQLPFVLLFLLLTAAGLFGTQFPDRNISTIATWTVWWGGVIFTFVLFGRLWCAVCPWAAIADWVQRLALWRVNGRPLSLGMRWPARFRNLYLMAAAFVLITWAEFAFDMVTSPRNTAYLALVILIAAIVVSVLYERRTFCRYLCPIGGMIGAYSSCSGIELRALDRAVCHQCSTKDCMNGNDRGYGCPVYEYPESMNTSFHCTLCSECVKTCPSDNISIRTRGVASELADAKRERSADEGLMALLTAGIALFHGLTMIPLWFHIQERLYQGAGMPPAASATIVLIVFLGLVFSAYMLISAAAGGSSFTRQAFALVPLALFYHLGHNCLHLFGEGARLIPTISDPFGLDWDLFGTAGIEPFLLLPLPVINLMQWLFVAAGTVISMYVVWKRGERLREKLVMGIAVLIITGIYSWMLTQPMVMRIGI